MNCKSYATHFSSYNFSPLHQNLSIGSHFNFPIVQFHPCQNSSRGPAILVIPASVPSSVYKERWDNVSMRKWERISFPRGQGGRTPTQHQFNNYFQILSGWKYWLTGVTSIVLGLFGFLGNFFAIAVLWDEFLWSSCDETVHHFFKFLHIFALVVLLVLWRVSLSPVDRRCRQFYKISKISRRLQVS